MNHKKKTFMLALLSILVVTLFLVIGLKQGSWEYALSKRIPKVAAMIVTGCAIAFSSMIFQTISNNRILTPSVLGLDSLYIFIQTVGIFVFGYGKMDIITNKQYNFILSVTIMVLFSLVLYKLLFQNGTPNIFFLLLIGMIFGTLFQSISSFMQMLIDPNEFLSVQSKMFATFNNINTDVLLMATVVVVVAVVYTYRHVDALDVLSLGRDQAINLGVNYDKVVKRMLVVIFILVAIATSLVGPITFLGLLVVNLSREFLNTYEHKYLLINAVFISIIALIGGQLIVERILNFNTPLSAIINFIGGMYFIHLLLKEEKE